MDIYQRNLGLPPCGAADCDRPITHVDSAGCGFCGRHADDADAVLLGGDVELSAWWCLAVLAQALGGNAALAWSELDGNEFPIPDDESETPDGT